MKKSLTSLGAIENLKKSRIRDIIYESKILGNCQRYYTKFDKAIFNFYLKGMSCRRIRDTFERVFNTYFSNNQVSEMLKKLQEKLDIWQKQNINDIYDALIMDGIWINVKTLPKLIRKTMKKLTKGVILAVMGLKKDGTKKISDHYPYLYFYPMASSQAIFRIKSGRSRPIFLSSVIKV